MAGDGHQDRIAPDAVIGSAGYNYFRDYDPATGRYVQSDPLGIEAGINTYLYADANPVMKVDPLGLDAIPAPGPLIIPPAFVPGTPEFNDLVDSGTRAVNDLIDKMAGKDLPKTGPCKKSEWDYCYRKCGGRAKTNGCYVSLRWPYRQLGIGGFIRPEQRIVNCNCDDGC